MFRREKGAVLPAVVIITLIVIIIGFSLLEIARTEIVLTRKSINRVKAFYLAEAGLAHIAGRLRNGQLDNIEQTTLGDGSYQVDVNCNQNPAYAISTGRIGNETKRIKVQASFLAPPFEHAIFALNKSGSTWAFQLRGTGNPKSYGSVPGAERGGKDIINGNIFVDGDAYFYEKSSVNPAPAPNTWELDGDVGATGSINVSPSATVTGTQNPFAEEPFPFDIEDMDYASNNTHNVGQIFQNAGVSSGHLPAGNELRDVFVKNPTDRATECATTAGNDYFFEPSSGFVTGTPKTGDTPLHAGDNRVYYVDGDVWIESHPTYGFKMDGKATIVATGDIHICDNLQYKDASSLLGLVALGKYDSSGELISGGNIYFGDPVYGNMAVFSAMMFAANNFLFNIDRITSRPAEPDSGFTIYGSFSAMNEISINRDWYTNTFRDPVNHKWVNESRPAYYKPSTGQWVDLQTGTILTSGQISSLRHYQMIVNYDDRVRSPETQPPGLPRGTGKIFMGFSNWEEL